MRKTKRTRVGQKTHCVIVVPMRRYRKSDYQNTATDLGVAAAASDIWASREGRTTSWHDDRNLVRLFDELDALEYMKRGAHPKVSIAAYWRVMNRYLKSGRQEVPPRYKGGLSGVGLGRWRSSYGETATYASLPAWEVWAQLASADSLSEMLAGWREEDLEEGS